MRVKRTMNARVAVFSGASKLAMREPAEGRIGRPVDGASEMYVIRIALLLVAGHPLEAHAGWIALDALQRAHHAAVRAEYQGRQAGFVLEPAHSIQRVRYKHTR